MANIKMVDSFCILGLIIGSKGASSQEIRHRLALKKSIQISIKITFLQAMAFTMILCGSQSSALKKQDRKNIDSLILKRTPENTMNNWENKEIYNWKNESRVLTWVIND